MASETAVATAFAALDIASLPRPRGLESARDVAVAVRQWARWLRAVADRDLAVAVDAYVLSGARFWPTPGQILALAPRSAGTLIEEAPRRGPYDLAPPEARAVVLERWQAGGIDADLPDEVLYAQLDALTVAAQAEHLGRTA